ncbi:MAG: hypothetical protein EPN79_15725 [Burkholderiaceae bacterium]|nr:MAG: hypothetical protein EPN79_15725 [Burkholderiaceae bacterium]
MTAQPLAATPKGQVDTSYMDRLKQARIDESLLVDAVLAYANKHFDTDEEREEFVDRMSEPPYEPQVRKAVLDVVFAVIAASELPTDDAFQALIQSLDVSEEDDVIREVKRALLASMVDSDVEFEDEQSERSFLSRLEYVGACIGIG